MLLKETSIKKQLQLSLLICGSSTAAPYMQSSLRSMCGFRAVCTSQSLMVASKLWGRGAQIRHVSWSRWMHRLESGEQCSRASWLGSEPQSQWHINRLELEAVFLALKDFRPQLEQQHVLIHTDNTSVVSYINHRSLQCSVQTGSKSPAMGVLSLPLHQSSAHPRSLEPRG